MFFIELLLENLKPQCDDDEADRLNYYYTPMLLVGYALAVLAKQHFGEPIQCWAPAQFTDSWQEYAETHCFTENTYFVSPKETLPENDDERRDKEIAYYQWVPIVLAIQAFLFLLPQLIWRYCSKTNGLSVKFIVFMAKQASSMPVDDRKDPVDVIVGHIRSILVDQHRLKSTGFFSIPNNGAFLTVFYLCVKVLYLIQVSFQFIFLNSFLNTSWFWGYSILGDILNHRSWEETGRFPRVTFCDFDVNVLGTKHTRTVQCVLVVNFYNEKYYLFLWFWLVSLFFFTFANLAAWIWKMKSDRQRDSFLISYLPFRTLEGQFNRLRRFSAFLGPDGVFLLRLISKNSGDLITADIVEQLWKEVGHYLANSDDLDSMPDQDKKRIAENDISLDIEVTPQS